MIFFLIYFIVALCLLVGFYIWQAWTTNEEDWKRFGPDRETFIMPWLWPFIIAGGIVVGIFMGVDWIFKWIFKKINTFSYKSIREIKNKLKNVD